MNKTIYTTTDKNSIIIEKDPDTFCFYNHDTELYSDYNYTLKEMTTIVLRFSIIDLVPNPPLMLT